MREVNYRCWDKKLNMMHDRAECYGVYQPLLPDNEELSFEDFMMDKDRFVLMQFTGMTDNKGKEIYEGDIIVHDGENKVIDFKNGSFGIDHQPTARKPHERILSSTKWEVVGNIYQNPDLL